MQAEVYMVGTTNRVKNVPTVMPHAMTRPIQNRLFAPAPVEIISGTTPSTMATVVMRIGRKRNVADLTTASCSLNLHVPVIDWRIPQSECHVY